MPAHRSRRGDPAFGTFPAFPFPTRLRTRGTERDPTPQTAAPDIDVPTSAGEGRRCAIRGSRSADPRSVV